LFLERVEGDRMGTEEEKGKSGVNEEAGECFVDYNARKLLGYWEMCNKSG
jgi:hypothetical protein